MRLSKLFGIAAVALAASSASANAQQQIQVGVLQCVGGQNIGFLVGSVTTLECSFQGSGRRPDGYVAIVKRFGVDVGFTEKTQFSWTAYGPTPRISRGGLTGKYGGVGANASLGVGFGGNFLVGGPGNAYALQPVSLQNQTGLNVAAGIASIELRPTGPVRVMRRHRRR